MPRSILDDIRYAVRMLRKTPVFTVVALLCVALGAGAVTTIFSAMNAVVLRPLPGASGQDRLVNIDRRSPDDSEGAQASYGLYQAWREATTMAGVGAWSKVDLAIGVDGVGHAVYGNIVSGNYFSVLGVTPAAGRFFAAGEGAVPMADPVIVVSHRFWRTWLNADPAALGRTVQVNGRPYTLIGVAPEEFRGAFTPLRLDAWVPLSMQPQLRPRRDLDNAVWLWTFGRLAPGVTRQAASAELSAILATHAATQTNYRTYTNARVTWMTGLPEDARSAFLGFSAVFFGAALFVLLIASVNVASMLSARAVARRREMAVRTALGAGRGRLVRQLLTEILLLFSLGSLGAIGLAASGTAALERLPIPGDTPLLLELSPDGRVLGFALGLSLLTGLVFGLGPALQASRVDLTSRLREDSAGAGVRRSIVGSTLIVGQLALSLLLLVAAGLFLRALHQGAQVDPRFDPNGVAIATLNTEAWGYDEAAGRAFFDTLRRRLTERPSVTGVSAASIVPLTMSGSGGEIETRASGEAQRLPVRTSMIDPGYLATLDIPLVAGRDFIDGDGDTAPRVAIVNETLARKLGGAAALGQVFDYYGEPHTIVGIAADAKYSDLAERTPNFVYLSMAQRWSPSQTVFVRSAGGASAGVRAIAESVAAIDPLAPAPTAIPMTQATAIVLLPQKAAAWVTAALGLTGLTLATVGLYGLLAYSAARRRREIGVRMALGARPGDVVRLIVRDGMRLTGGGLALGLCLAVVATRVIASLLFDVSPLDVPTFAATTLLLAGAALAACWLPARRAAATDPTIALRSE